ncbi:MAG: vWA domain-containing protein [Bacillota bacterium]
MPYTAEISRANPSCFLFLIDQSGSMRDPFGADPGRSKAHGVSDAINRLLQNLVIKCAKTEGVRDYYHVGVIGYGYHCGPALAGPLAGRDLVPISEVADNPARVEKRTRKIEDGTGGLVEHTVKFPVWFDPVASGGTPMCQALRGAKGVLETWISRHPDGFPPIVINITDGEATDGDPTAPAGDLTFLAGADGNVLLFNLHLSSHKASPVEFPDREEELPDNFAKMLFRMSSTLPDYMRSFAQEEGYAIAENSRGFVFNADMVSIIRFLDIGTRPGNLR